MSTIPDTATTAPAPTDELGVVLALVSRLGEVSLHHTCLAVEVEGEFLAFIEFSHR